MKKVTLTLVATAALALAACTDQEIRNDIYSQQESPISFETFMNKATRGENSSSSEQNGLEAHHLTFSLWGYKDVDTTKYVFKGQLVSCDTTNNNTNWEYSPIRFWDNNSNSYEFYAAAPDTTKLSPSWKLNKNDGQKINDDYFTLADFIVKDSTLADTVYVESMAGQPNIDLMIASSKNVANSGTGYSGAVQLDFNHILSRLNVTVKQGAALKDAGSAGKLYIDSVVVYNMSGKASFNENDTTTEADGDKFGFKTVKRWTHPTTAGDSLLINYTGKGTTGHRETLDSLSTKSMYILQSLVIPQTVKFETVSKDGKVGGNKVGASNKPYIKVAYRIGTGDTQEKFVAYYNLADAFSKSDSLNFNEGWQYTLNIKIGSDDSQNNNQITFDPNVYKWDDYKTPCDTVKIE